MESRSKFENEDLKTPYSFTTLLKHHQFAYHRMMVDGCVECGVKKGEPCKPEKLAGPRDILRHDEKIHYANQTISKLFGNTGRGYSQAKINKKQKNLTMIF